jgi:hypothetical protein
MTVIPDPRSTAAIPISHSSDRSAPVKATASVVLPDVLGEVTVAAVVAAGGVAAGVVAANVAAAGVTVTLPSTEVMV